VGPAVWSSTVLLCITIPLPLQKISISCDSRDPSHWRLGVQLHPVATLLHESLGSVLNHALCYLSAGNSGSCSSKRPLAKEEYLHTAACNGKNMQDPQPEQLKFETLYAIDIHTLVDELFESRLLSASLRIFPKLPAVRTGL
jgi:hypothetical protein